MADWDDDEFEPEDVGKKLAAPKTDKWEGEDSDDDIKDAWDVDSDEEKKENTPEGEGTKVVQKKKKKKLAEKIAEKEEARARELEEQRRLREENDALNTPEGKLAEKIRLQKLEESNQLELAKEMLGVEDSSGGLNFRPQTEEEYNELRTSLVDKLSTAEGTDMHQDFIVQLISNLCMNLSIPNLKKIKSESEAFISAKLKEEKAAKGKKGKPAKATIRMDTDRAMFGRGLDDGYNDMDDFM
eukprot:TRINITY_DN5811_c0_g2_i1.p1 TRINITY_DN5811_c0_g2~~TRINITY_DN5811_c0_g2_i1.p1  ORF type:complete len:242 (-),score=86.77 TRINITY_DN5811_c0_g2_i1:351-1076(-)